MNINYIAEPTILIDAAFSRGRKAASQYPSQKKPFYTLKGKEIAKIDASAEYFMETLEKGVKGFPSIDKLDPFYGDLVTSIINVDEVRKNISSIYSVTKIVKKMRMNSIVLLKQLPYRQGKEKEAMEISRRYFGRVASVIKGLKGPIAVYNDAAKKMKELPKIDVKEECFILAGLPNVGKSTLLSKVTDSKPEIAAYPFTTKGLNVGHFMKKYLPVPVIDTPGLLDRPLLERNKIELKAITALQHLKGTILFVVDPLDDLEKQKNLFAEIKKLFSEKGFVIVINKTDIASEQQTEEAKDAFKGYEIIIEGKDLSTLRKYLVG